MKHFKSISSVQNPCVKAVVKLRRHAYRKSTLRFIAEGYREVSRAVEAGLSLLEMYFCPEMTQGCGSINTFIETRRREIVFEVTPTVMKKLSYRQNPEGLLGVLEQPRYRLKDLRSIQAPVGRPWPANRWPKHELWLVAIGTQKPGNLGAMARSAEAAGCRGLLVADGEVDVFNPNAIRASTGAVFVLPVVAASPAAIFGFLGKRGVEIITACPSSTTTFDSVRMTGPIAFVMGAEDRGLALFSQHWAKWGCPDAKSVSIPMMSKTVDSLNLSSSTAILLYEAVRQRTSVSISPPIN